MTDVEATCQPLNNKDMMTPVETIMLEQASWLNEISYLNLVRPVTWCDRCDTLCATHMIRNMRTMFIEKVFVHQRSKDATKSHPHHSDVSSHTDYVFSTVQQSMCSEPKKA